MLFLAVLRLSVATKDVATFSVRFYEYNQRMEAVFCHRVVFQRPKVELSCFWYRFDTRFHMLNKSIK